MKTLEMTCGGEVIVDDRVANVLTGYRIRRCTYGNRRPVISIPRGAGRWPETASLAHLIAHCRGTGFFVQHLNGDVLDCRHVNLKRVRTRGEAGKVNTPKPPLDSAEIMNWPSPNGRVRRW